MIKIEASMRMRNSNGFQAHVDTLGERKFCSPSANIEAGKIRLNKQETEIYI